MDSLSQIPGIGPKILEKLNRLNINHPKDLLYHFPSRYIDFSHSVKINSVLENENITITGKVIDFKNIFTRNGKNIQKAIVSDDTGKIDLIWFNQPYLSKNIKAGDNLSFAGTVSLYLNKKTIIAPEYGQYNTGKIISVYPETSGLTSKWFRKIIQIQINNLLKDIKETLPSNLIKKFKLLDLKISLLQIHCPTNPQFLEQARTRLATEEILSLQIRSYLLKKEWQKNIPKTKLKVTKIIDKKIKDLIKSLPYKLTDSQDKVLAEIFTDLTNQKQVMNRLLQGDVGSGKTIIALLACYLTHLNNSLSVLIAPTEILANQHYQNFQEILKNKDIPIFLLTGSKKIDLKKIPKNGILISTHAVIYQKLNLKNKISLLIVDEQHKFGVKQRSFLNSSLKLPHCLTMTATPIPRTISLTLLGNLDISIIDTLPQNRLQIKTFLVPDHKKTSCYKWIETEIKKTGCQAFIVCPFIDISESMASVKSAIQEFEHLSKEVFPNLKLGLIHGKIKSVDREKIIKQFQDKQLDILITTPIIEVGVDIPNSSIIIIQSADRFGLAALHQLRGRVGRGHLQSYCYLFTESNNQKAIDRLNFLEKNHNGLKIAEFDLKSRGPGEAFSTIQHGFPSLKIASFSDTKLISLSQEILKEIIDNYPDYNFSQITSENITAESIISN
ncbi:MAG: ATP-dependent DNA helicase RecG [Candidatus Shapirobacteria bacterium]|nr:ATP-dependent DNA helicase RecG [Candidatus Shapirobacteria bacterium]MDD4410398.1 ATP-dependent DNA helicase RecG [Candidatus Shapirobacteria bacterium]